MSPQMGVVTDADLAAAVAAHAALTVTHGTVDDIADQTDIENHRLDADAHHSEEIPEGRARSATTIYLTLPGVAAYSSTTYAHDSDVLYYYPIYVRTPITIDQVTIEVTVAAGAGNKCRVGIYASDINWQPLALVVASGELAIDAVAVVNGALAATVLQEGRYLIVFTIQANATFRAIRYTGWPVSFVTTLGILPTFDRLRVNQAYGALADPGIAWDGVTPGGQGFNIPVVLRVSIP